MRHSDAPSSRAASFNSTATCVSAAYRVSAMKGTACQTTSSQMQTHASTGSEDQSLLVMSPKMPSCVSIQLITPYCGWKSHDQTIDDATFGIAQARISTTVVR